MNADTEERAKTLGWGGGGDEVRYCERDVGED